MDGDLNVFDIVEQAVLLHVLFDYFGGRKNS